MTCNYLHFLVFVCLHTVSIIATLVYRLNRLVFVTNLKLVMGRCLDVASQKHIVYALKEIFCNYMYILLWLIWASDISNYVYSYHLGLIRQYRLNQFVIIAGCHSLYRKITVKISNDGHASRLNREISSNWSWFY